MLIAVLLLLFGLRPATAFSLTASTMAARRLLPLGRMTTARYCSNFASPLPSPSPLSSAAATSLTPDQDAHFMRLALRHAQFAFREKEVPIGAVIVDAQGKVIAAGRNSVETLKDATAHAELSVLRKASQVLGNWRLQGCILYTTVEPCAMCMGAAQGFRIARLVYGTTDHRLGACGSWVNLADKVHPFANVEVRGGVLAEESSVLLRRFFQLRRREAKEASRRGIEDGSIEDFERMYLEGGLNGDDAEEEDDNDERNITELEQ